MKYLTIITARKGSKRLPNKNILNFNNRPLCEWTILAAKEARLNQTIIVSTDCPEVQKIAIEHKVNCESLRPPELCTDEASSIDVILYEIEKALMMNIDFDGILLLQPTSPQRNSRHIEAAVSLFEKTGADAVQSYCESECPPQWLFQINEMLKIDQLPEKIITSQNAGSYYRINGSIYLITKTAFQRTRSLTPSQSIAYIMDRAESIDIDNEIDFLFSEFLEKRRTKGQ